MSAETFFRDLFAKAGITINGDRPWDLQVNDPRAYERMLRDGSIGFGESFVEGWIDCNQVDEMTERLERAELAKAVDKKLAILESLRLRLRPVGSRSRSFEIGERHYDIGNDLYEAMLDRRMVYSCAYWQRAQQLDEAQEDKLEIICRKLQLAPGLRLLDVGCGWGGLARFAVERYGVKVVGICVSKQQIELARARCVGLPVEFRYIDYRELTETFDRIVSVEMFEHVGRRYYGTFFDVCARCLKPSGIFLLHTTGQLDEKPINPWYDKYILPGVEFATLDNIMHSFPRDLVLEHFETWEGTHYAKTLMSWFECFDMAWPRLKQSYDDAFYRMWKLYVQGSAGAFRAERLRILLLVFSKGGIPGGYTYGRHCFVS